MLRHAVVAECRKLKGSCIWLAFLFLPAFSVFVGSANFSMNRDILTKEWQSLWTQVSLFYGDLFLAVLLSIYFRDEHTAADHTAFQVLIPENLRFQRPVQRQNRPSEPLAADRERNRLRAGAGVPIVKNDAVAVLTAAALPAYQAGRLFPLRRCHAVKGTVRPAFQWRQVFIGVISHAFPPFCFPLPFLRTEELL